MGVTVPMEGVPVHLQPSGGSDGPVQLTHNLDALVQMNSQTTEMLEQQQMVVNDFAITALKEEMRLGQVVIDQQRELRRLEIAFLVVVVVALSMLLWQAVAFKALLRDTTEGTESLRRMLEEYRSAQRAVDDMRFLEHVVRLPTNIRYTGYWDATRPYRVGDAVRSRSAVYLARSDVVLRSPEEDAESWKHLWDAVEQEASVQVQAGVGVNVHG